MRRRDVAVCLASLAARPAWGSAALAQSRTYRVGMLFPAGASPGAQRLIEALAERGYAQGANVIYYVRAAGQEPERLPQLARELVELRPDVIVSATEPAARALAEATRQIPIVLALIGDPIALELTRSIARPTSNVTGFTTGHETITAKRVQLLTELVPAALRIALLWVQGNMQNMLVLERARQAAVGLNVELVSLPVSYYTDVPRALRSAEQEAVDALLVAADPVTLRNRRTIIDYCFFAGLPAMHSYAVEVRDGALISYGSDVVEDFSRAADYVDRILKGARVADLPFQEPAHIALAINLKTAKSIGLAVPLDLLVRADEVIE
jgi:putative ABC transport system substrate-binding protein